MSSLKAGRPSSRVEQKTSISDFEEKKEFVRLNFNLDREIHQKFKLYCVKNDKAMADVLLEYISTLI